MVNLAFDINARVSRKSSNSLNAPFFWRDFLR
jgi:hypothetical protein